MEVRSCLVRSFVSSWWVLFWLAEHAKVNISLILKSCYVYTSGICSCLNTNVSLKHQYFVSYYIIFHIIFLKQFRLSCCGFPQDWCNEVWLDIMCVTHFLTNLRVDSNNKSNYSKKSLHAEIQKSWAYSTYFYKHLEKFVFPVSSIPLQAH